jgi:dipeptidyl aminopeptidase/acylaminoacyl peptidase
VGLVAAGVLRPSESVAQGKHDALFTVRDSIEMVHVLGATGDPITTSSTGIALFSPDLTRFLIRTRRGALQDNATVESLFVFHVRNVTRALSGGEKAPKVGPKLIAQLSVRDDWGELSELKWLDNRQIAFIAEGDNQKNQVYLVDVATGGVRQLTHSDTNIRAFDESEGRLVYWAVAPSESWASKPAAGKTIDVLISPDDYLSQQYRPRLNLFVQGRDDTHGTRVRMPTVRLFQPFQRVWLSRSARYAVILAPATNAPEYWSEYEFAVNKYVGFVRDQATADPESADLLFQVRYMLVDLQTGSTQALLDAPYGWAANDSVGEVEWEAEDHRVILGNTFLPLGESDLADQGIRKKRPAIAEVDLRTGRIAPIVWEPAFERDVHGALVMGGSALSVKFDEGANALTIVQQRRGDNDAGNNSRFADWNYIRRGDGAWREVTIKRHPPEISVQLKQSLNQRPRIFASAATCRCSAEIFDPNPQLERFAFGKASIYQWTDANGTRWQGGLVLPTHYDPRKQYPVILQTHGFRPDEFLVDGPDGYTTAFAAQPFAGEGFVVLQIEENRIAMSKESLEDARFTAGMYAAVGKLVTDGFADRDRVGLIAFSRTGAHALSLLAAYPSLLAAATFADATQGGYVQYLFDGDGKHSDRNETMDLIGGRPSIGQFDQWMAVNPLYKLPGVQTPIRIEAMGPLSLIIQWETYSILQDAGRTVDLIYFPRGSHVLVKPEERQASQGGNVDWFRFWLQGSEDPDPSKAEQYRRWRALRVMRNTQGSTVH